MRYIRSYNNYTKVNEELEIKSLVTAIAMTVTSLLTNPAKASQTSQNFPEIAKENIQKQATVISEDFKNLKKNNKDPKIASILNSLELLKSWESTKGLDSIKAICSEIQSYLDDNKLELDNEELINHLSSADIEKLKLDYEELLNTYNDYKNKSNINIALLSVMLCLLIFCSVLIGKKVVTMTKDPHYAYSK